MNTSFLHISVRPEPFHGVGQGLFRRGLRQAEFADGAFGVEPHLIFGHAHARHGRFGRNPGNVRKRLVRVRDGQGNPARDLRFGRGNAGDFREHIQGLFHRPIALGIAEDISLAGLPFFRGENVTDGNIAHMHPVQSGIYICRQLAVQKVQDELAGGCGFDVARADGRAGVDDDDWQAGAGKFESDFLRLPFRPFVMISKLRFGNDFLLRRRNDDRVFDLWQTDAADRAGVNNATAAGFPGGFQDVARAGNVRLVHGLIITQPKMVAGSYMETPIAPFHFTKEKAGIKEVADGVLVTGAGQGPGIRLLAQQELDAMAAREKFVHQIGADEPGSAGDKAFHKENRHTILRKFFKFFHKKFSPRLTWLNF